jgi:hypothetical protein
MRLEQRDGALSTRQVGAAVVRPEGMSIFVELGPADGPPHTRVILSKNEATQLVSALRGVLAGRSEEIILTEE